MNKHYLSITFSAALLISLSISSQALDGMNAFRTSQPLVTASINETDSNNLDDISAAKNISDDETYFDVVATDYYTEDELVELRKIFEQAEQAITKKDEASYQKLAAQLKDYPLYPYLKYQWLSKHLDEQAQVELFLSLHDSSRYASKLKYRWLFHLAKQRQWPLFMQYYTSSSNTSLQCYYHRAQYNTGDKQAALEGARELWSAGHSQPKVCDPLFSQLKKSELFTEELIWQRFDAALRNNKVSLAIYLKGLMKKSQASTAQLWINLHRRPSHHIQKLLALPSSERTSKMFTHTVVRLANKDITSAIRIWDGNKHHYIIDKEQRNKIEKKLAFKLVFKRESGAYERLSKLDMPDESSRAWRVRVALKEQDWNKVLAALDALSDTEKKDEKWQYWKARALLETGNVEASETIFSTLSKERSFYGYLAADRVNRMYQLANDPVQVSEQAIDWLTNQQEFRVAYELMKLDRESEAKLQWWHALKQLNDKQINIAAKLAQRWNWDEIAIFTIAKVKHWDDIEMRFPLSYSDKIEQNSAKQNLNPAIIFGLVRRESAFNENARSPTGARGLMQIMPQTGKQIAKNLKERWRGTKSLDNPVTNLKYGSYYYQKLLKQFSGHYALATAAYNAGPNRVKAWLPESGSLPADIWIETIPFRETREYVIAVTTYALIYQQRTQTAELSMNDFTPDVLPLNN
jgi:soluble lytic murein transglycosylase